MARSAVDTLLRQAPFAEPTPEREQMFRDALRESFQHHLSSNSSFARLCEKRGFAADQADYSDLAALPYLPVGLFKRRNLLSVPEESVKITLSSSGTSGTPSTIGLDNVTARRQTIASTKVIADYLGKSPRPFVIVDKPPVDGSTSITARTAATKGYGVLASERHYILSADPDRPTVDVDKLLEVAATTSEPICLFGFTFLVFAQLIGGLRKRGVTVSLPAGSTLVHTGGWKKLEAEKVSKADFFDAIEACLGIPPNSVYDFYGFTEQMGLVYASVGQCSRLTSIYAEIIIRDFNTLEPVPDGQDGLVQLVTPLPHSYPGVSVLTEDVGRILGRGKDANGRYGTQFELIGRAPKAESRGCSDAMNDPAEVP